MESSPPRKPPNPALPYREDCWSEGETSVLVDAWGDRYLELSRGNLRQKHWQEVADAVNSRPAGARRPPRTDVQCKNRIDTLKKKYKVEKARIVDSGGALASQWQFFTRLDALIGSSVSGSKKPSPPSPPPPLALPLPYHRKSSPLPLPAAAAVSSRPEKRHPPALPPVNDSFRRRFTTAAAAAAAAAAASAEVDTGSSSRSFGSSRSSRERPAKRWKRGREDETDGIRALARAITRFGEMYEKVEAAKQRQMMELERQRMEFAKNLEFQRMEIFVDSQIKLEKIKRSGRSDAVELGSLAALPFLFDSVSMNLIENY
ncbi:Homeobox-like domain-containing protein [Dioscorea alata]|uniref:Homeobox-like domain-containing protein n=8 Tax=Dioscorea alata TaxID=55571 RepID=A0ACB7UBY7_DIOAL|nr:Homeobox-like domain-containing protein [Dioscorea alata]KAH7657804.1 Homeobox-like domain-containing protein [Dioscorea alata]KAH7657806.1 Homeobox-like domain-containing protein [Dioscorea alata]KAH7657807.1 Homeobox-like domain-containing protein [Dioscorea alata]KAH7657809.1 Homeobox-like domain-containing protein [Dioscorea alata]